MSSYRYLIERSLRGVGREQISPYAWAAGLTLVVGAPWVTAGYLFGTDWPGPRHFLIPDHVWSGAAWQTALAAASAVLGSEFTTKLFLLGSLFVAALTAYKAVPVGGFIVRATAATVYTVNPFVYGRIHYGQLALVAAYALLPWLAIELRALVLEPSVRAALFTAASLTMIGILDLHLVLPAATVSTGVCVAFALQRFRDTRYLIRLAAAAVGAGAAATLASTYWLLPLLMGANPQGQELSGFGSVDLAVFRTVPDAGLGLLPNTLGLYGFWAENVMRFPSMKEFVPFWPLVLLALLALGAVGAAASLWRPEAAFRGARPWVIALLGAGAIAVILDMGVAEPHVKPLIQWLDAEFTPYRGMRDAGKWAALIALVYAQLVPLGILALLGSLQRHLAIRFEALSTLAAGLLLALPLYYGNGVLFGMHGELRPSPYPAGWYAADRLLLSDPQPGRTLFVPWHRYLKFGFIRNVNAVIETPAPSFFSVPTVVSADPEVAGLRPSNTIDQSLISRLITAHGDADWPRALATVHVKYIVLAHEVDWREYQYLDHQARLVKIADYGSVTIYRNLDWQP